MSEITKTKDQKPNTKYIWFIFFSLVVIVYLTGLTIPLLGPDEPRYAQVAREMFERHDFVTPTLGGFDWFEKPALLYWLQIVAYKIFGVSEFSARFGSALFGLGTVLSLWILGRKWSVVSGQEADEKTKVEGQRTKDNFANWLGLIAASSLGIIVFSRGASFDIILTFPVTASLVSFFIFDLTQGREDARTQSFSKILPLALFYFFIGVALIAKGLVGIVFPFGTVALYYLLSRRFPSKTFVFSLFWGTLGAVLVASVWYLPMYRVNGWKFVDEFFIQHHFQRFTSNKYQHPQPFYFFFWVLPLMTLPWMPFFFAAIWNLIKGAISRKAAETQSENLLFSSSPLLLFAISWLLVPLVFFSLSGSNLPGYILPAVPGALILTADYAWRFVQNRRARQIIVQMIAVLTLVVIAVLAQFFVTGFLHEETVKHLINTANSRGYTNEKVLTVDTVSHSAEFYAAGRLLREADGKQKRLYGVSQVIEEMNRQNVRQTLVLIPTAYMNQLTRGNLVETEILDDNGELSIVLVKLK